VAERTVCTEGNVHFLENEIPVTMNSHVAEVLLLYTAEISRCNGKAIWSGSGGALYGIKECQYQYIILGLNFMSELASEGHRCVVF
jgi:hypothetical protein